MNSLSYSDIVDKIFTGDATEILKMFPDNCIDCAVTSPPYWNLRDYGVNGQMGLEGTFIEYIHRMCNLFDEVKRVLKDTGTIWVNLGDTYYGSTKVKPEKEVRTNVVKEYNEEQYVLDFDVSNNRVGKEFYKNDRIILSKKSLCAIPERFIIEMINRGWIFRNKVIWHKPSIMPRPLKDRFPIDFEEIFFFTKSEDYYFEQQYEKMVSKVNINASTEKSKYSGENVQIDRESMAKYAEKVEQGLVEGRIKRCVWSVNTSNDRSSHVAPYPEELISPIIKAGCPAGGIVLDTFMGTGTTALVALKQDKHFVGVDIDDEAIVQAKNKIFNFQNQTTIFDII